MTATATPIGSARTSARKLVVTVPKIAGSAPNDSVTGFQSTPVRKPGPNRITAGAACCNRMTTIRIRRAGAIVATAAVSVRNRSGPRAAAGVAAGLLSTAVAKLPRLGDFGQLALAVQAVTDAANRDDLERRDAG